MGNAVRLCSSEKSTHVYETTGEEAPTANRYFILVKTGDKKGAGTNGNVR